MNSEHLQGLQEAYNQVNQQLDEVSQKTATKAFASRANDAFEEDDVEKSEKAERTKERIIKKYGKKAGQHAERAAHAKIFGRKSSSMPKKPTNEEIESLDVYESVLSYLLDEGFASSVESADKIILNMSESWFEGIMEARRSEKEGKGSPERRLDDGRTISGQRGEKKRLGAMGGRHFWSGGEGGSNTERGKKKVKGAKGDENQYTQHGRTQVFQGRKETPGKYSAMQSRKRGSGMGSRFD